MPAWNQMSVPCPGLISHRWHSLVPGGGSVRYLDVKFRRFIAHHTGIRTARNHGALSRMGFRYLVQGNPTCHFSRDKSSLMTVQNVQPLSCEPTVAMTPHQVNELVCAAGAMRSKVNYL